MRLCNPDCLIEWREVEPPRFKKDYVGKLARVDKFPRHCPEGPHLPPDGAVCAIARRGNDYGGGEFQLTVEWRCPTCDRPHEGFIPEADLNSGNLRFVEPVGLADATQALALDRPALLYLATSYSHPEPAKRAARANLASECAAWLMRKGWSVVSPLSMGHAIIQADWERGDLSADFKTWREPCLRMLEMSDALVVLMLDGIRESVGVAAEIDHARRLGLPCNQIRLPGEEAANNDASFEVVPLPKWWR